MAKAPSSPNRPVSGILLLLAALALLSPASRAEEVRLPNCPGCNLILISLSNVGAGRMTLYGYSRKTTPQLDRWARKAVVFESAFTPASWTLPVGVSLFTSLQPYSHGVLRRSLQNSLDPGTSTLPEILRDRGYRTAAFTGGLDYYPGFSHMRGFQDVPDNGEFAGFAQSIPQAQSWLKENGKSRFFLFLHGYEAHCPFYPSPEFRGRFNKDRRGSIFADPEHCVRGYREESEPSPDGTTEVIFASSPCSGFRTRCDFGQKTNLSRRDVSILSDAYDEDVLEVDALVGDFLKSLDAKTLKRTIVVIFSDHGEMFAKHGRFGRLGNVRGVLFDDAVRVPLVIRFPDGPSRRIAGLAQLIDVMPTLLKALDIPMPEGRQGVDLSSAIASGAEPNRYAYAGAVYGPHPVYYPFLTENDMIRDGRWKLIEETVFKTILPLRKPTSEVLRKTAALYDLEQDPQELRDVSAEHPDVAADLRKQLGSWKLESKGFSSEPPATREFPKEMLEKARKRGYW